MNRKKLSTVFVVAIIFLFILIGATSSGSETKDSKPQNNTTQTQSKTPAEQPKQEATTTQETQKTQPTEDTQPSTTTASPSTSTNSQSSPTTNQIESNSSQVKKSESGICHEKGVSQYYDKTKSYTPYSSIGECLASGGRLPK